jgi:hypothetical protein
MFSESSTFGDNSSVELSSMERRHMAKLKGMDGGKAPVVEAKTETDWDVVIDYELDGKIVHEEFMCEGAQMNPPGFFLFAQDAGQTLIRYALPAIVKLSMKKRMISRVTPVIS